MTNIFQVRWTVLLTKKSGYRKEMHTPMLPFPFRWTIHFCASEKKINEFHTVTIQTEIPLFFAAASSETCSIHHFWVYFSSKTTWYDLRCCHCCVTVDWLDCISTEIQMCIQQRNFHPFTNIRIWFWKLKRNDKERKKKMRVYL